LKNSEKPLRDWTPISIAKYGKATGSRLQVPAGVIAGIDGDELPPLLIRLGKGGRKLTASAEAINAVEGQDKVRVSDALWWR